MKVLSIKNFALYQHYKDRRPPWVKLHASVLDDYAFSCLQDASKAHLMLLWLLASQCDNKIPYDLAWITRQLGASSPVDIEELVATGFIEVSDDASRLIAPRKQSALAETEGETETEGEREAEKKKTTSARKPPRGGKRPSGFSLAPYIDAHREAFPGSDPPAGRYGKVFKKLEAKHGPAETLRRWRICLAAKGTFASPDELSSHWPVYEFDGGADGRASREARELEARAAALVEGDAAREARDAEWLALRMANSSRSAVAVEP